MVGLFNKIMAGSVTRTEADKNGVLFKDPSIATGLVLDSNIVFKPAAAALLFKDPSIATGLVLDSNIINRTVQQIEPAESLSAQVVGTSSITLAFTPPFYTGSITDYRVYEIQQHLGLISVNSINSINRYNDQILVVISDLKPSTSYTFKVTSSNGISESVPTNTITVSTTT